MSTTIQPGVHDITTRRDETGRRYRVYLFDDDLPTLVDAGHAGTAGTLITELEALGIDPARLLITHGDPDHVGGIDAITDRYDVDLFVPAQADIASEATPAGRFQDGEQIGPFTAVATPGHASHHYAFVHQDRSIAVVGDALFGSDLRGLPPGYFILPPGVYSQDLNQADESLANLLAFDFDIALPYHGSPVTENAYDKLDEFVNFPGKP